MLSKAKKTLVCALGIMCVMLFAAVGALWLMPKTTAQAEDASGFDVEIDGESGTLNFTALTEAWAKAKEADTARITMHSDAEITSTLVLSSGENITLDLNGHIISFNGTRGSVIRTLGILRLEDGDKTAAHSGTTITGGLITGGKEGYYDDGGGVYVEPSGKFYMTGGTISGNSATRNGGGVCVDGGGFYMSGGFISGNTAGAYGGGVYNYNALFEMSGGVISGNTSGNSGGGAYVNGAFNVSGKANITGNTHSGADDNVFLSNETISIVGELTEGAKIGIKNIGATPVATGFTATNNPGNKKLSEFFVHDNPLYCLYVSDETSGTVRINTHDYGTPAYEWSEDNAACTATRVCTRDGGHTQTETVTAVSENVAASCTVGSHTALTATFTNSAFSAQTKRINEQNDATGHSYATDSNVCSVCGEEKAKIYWCIDGTKLILSGTPSDADVSDSDKKGSFYFDERFSNYKAPWGSTGEDRESITTVEIKDGVAPKYSNNWFYRLDKIETVDLSKFDTSNLTEMTAMFNGCYSLKTVVFPASFDTSGVTKMVSLFNACHSLTEIVFSSSFDTSNVTDMTLMFYDCKALTEIAFPDNFDTAKVERMERMFEKCEKLTLLDISSFDILHLNEYGATDVFAGCKNLATIKTPAIIGDAALPLPVTYFWNGQPFTSVTRAAQGKTLTKHTDHSYENGVCTVCGEKVRIYWGVSVSGTTLTVSALESDVENSDEKDFFYYDEEFNSAPWSRYAGTLTQAVIKDGVAPSTTFIWFCDCMFLQNVDLSGLDTSAVTKMNYMFAYCANLTSLDLSSLDLSNVTETGQMLEGCGKLRTLKAPKAMGEASVTLPADFWNGSADVTVMTSADAGKTFVWHEEHSYAWVTETEPTCTQAGLKKQACVCGESNGETQEIAALGHSWGEWTVVKQPTAEEFGEERRVCAHDNSHYETRQLPKLTGQQPGDGDNGGDNNGGGDNGDNVGGNSGTSAPEKKPSMPLWEIFLIIAAVVVALALGGYIAFAIRRRRRTNDNGKNE